MKIHSKSKFGQKARKRLLAGAEAVYRAVSTTLGARGRNVVLWKPHETIVVHDGVTVSERVNPEDIYKNAGAEVIKQAARRQVDVVGDGTTVTIVLARQIAKEAEKIVESGVNPMSLRAGLEKGRDILVGEIEKLSKPVKTKKQKIEVATVSSEDEELGKLIGETLHKAGVEGVVTVEEAVGVETFVDHQDGMQIDSGYLAEHFVTNPKTMTASIENPRILVTDYKLDDVYKLVPLLKNLTEKNKERNLFVLANDVSGSVLATLVNNKMNGQLNSLAVKAPSFKQKEFLQDIASVVGAKFVSKDVGMELEDLTIDELGEAERVTADKDATIIVGGGGSKSSVDARVESIKTQIDEETNEFETEKLRERLAKLTGGVYVVNVGGHTEVEIREKKERAEDAVLATKAAIEDGIVPGGEVVYLPLIDKLEADTEEEDFAYRILKKALQAPFRKLVTNAGLDAGEMLAYLKEKDFGHGVNVETGQIEDLVKSGIVDPAKVSIEAIKNAVSVATQIVTSDAIVAEVEEKKDK